MTQINDKSRHNMKPSHSLKEMVSAVLGESANLTIERDDQIKIFRRNDFAVSLSDGQKVLLKLAVQLHAQQIALTDALVFLDEPENHLHPAVLNEVIDILLSKVETGQVWIATHSVSLIANLVARDT